MSQWNLLVKQSAEKILILYKSRHLKSCFFVGTKNLYWVTERNPWFLGDGIFLAGVLASRFKMNTLCSVMQ